jgi:PAS domain S-box-containing protein
LNCTRGLLSLFGYCQPDTFAWIFVFGALSNLVMVILLGRYRRRSSAIAWFQFASLLTGTFQAGLAIMGCATNAAVYNIGYMISQLLILILPLIFVYAFHLMNREQWLRKFWAVFFLAGIPLIMLALLWGTDYISVRGLSHAIDSGFGYQTASNGPLAPLKGAYVGIGFMIPLILLGRYVRHIHHPLKRREVGMIFWSLVPPIVAGVIFEGILPNAGVQTLPMGAILVTFTHIVIIYAMLKYGIYIFNVSTATGNIVRVMPGGLFIMDHTNTIQYVNQGAVRMLGYSERELIGTPVEKLFHTPVAYRHFEHQVEKLHGENSEIAIEDTAFTHKGAQTIPVSLNITRTNQRAQLVNTILVVTDISKLKQTEAELEREKKHVEQKVIERTHQLSEAQAQLSASVSSLPFGFALIDTEERIIFSNNKLADILKQPIPSNPNLTRRVLLEITAKYHKSIDLMACVQEAQTKRHPLERNISHGAQFFRFFFLPVTAGHAVLGTVLLIEDTTEAKAFERSRDEFFSIASHELRTPLTAIRGNAAMIIDMFADQIKEPAVSQMIDDIHEASTRLIDIVNDFLDVSRLEQGRMAFKKTRVNIPVLVKDILRQYGANSSAGVKLSLAHIGGDIPEAFVDPDRTRQIVINLVGNALKYTKKGSVKVYISATPHSVKITVTDTGEGIPVSSQHLLFRKFQQASGNILTRDSTRSSGLGLYISRLMAKGMSGTLRLDHTEVGKGSTFSLELPIVSTDPKDKASVINKGQGGVV